MCYQKTQCRSCSFVLEFIPAATHSLDLCVAGELRFLTELRHKAQFRGCKLGKSDLAKDLRMRHSLSEDVHHVPPGYHVLVILPSPSLLDSCTSTSWMC